MSRYPNYQYVSSGHGSSRRSEGNPTTREDEHTYYTGSHNQSHHVYDQRTSSSHSHSGTPRTTHSPPREQLYAYEPTHRAGRTATSSAVRSSAQFPSNDNNHTFGAFRQTNSTLEPVLPFSTRPHGIVPTSKYQDDSADPRKRFQCPDCNRRFDRQSGLDAHAPVHTGKRLYACPQVDCDKSFTVKSNLTRHLNKIHSRRESDADDHRYAYSSTSRESSDRSTPPNVYYPSSRR